MKTYQTHLDGILLAISFFLLVITSCQTEKFLSLQKSKMASMEEQKIKLKTEQKNLLQSSQAIRLTDSMMQDYQVSILPVDSFSFSIQDGFKGKALSIEIRGKQNLLKSISDSSGQFLQSHKLEQGSLELKHRQEQSAVSKTKEKESRMVFPEIILILIGILVLAVGWRYLKRIGI